MNIHLVRHREGEIRALVSLARTLNRHGVNYAAWSRKAEAEGDVDAYRKWRDKATKNHSHAMWELNRARLLRDQQEAANVQ